MAYTVVDKEVIVEYKISETETILDSGYYAWVAIYKNSRRLETGLRGLN